MSQIKLAILLLTISFYSCGQMHDENNRNATIVNNRDHSQSRDMTKANEMKKQKDTATFAAGCFWCIEEQFKQLNGVIEVVSGYTGGKTEKPTYKMVCSGSTGHAEACNVIYDPSIITFDELLAAFFVTHDPTQLNRQGADIGTQYRSAIFYRNEEQKRLSEYYIQKLNEEGAYSDKIVTEISPFEKFYVAEDHHQDYFEKNPNQAYCQFVIKPKLDKFRKVFKDKIKDDLK